MAVSIQAPASARHTDGRHATSRWTLAFVAASILLVALAAVAVVMAGGAPDPTSATGSSARVIDIAVLVFREGLESILVLSAITASLTKAATTQYRRPIGLGGMIGGAATLVTWLAVVGVLDHLTESVPALHLQAATGLLAIVVLLVVMNWFFHKIYWTGWIGFHTRRKQRLVAGGTQRVLSPAKVLFGLGLLGFTSVYREGFEVVLFLQSYRLSLGSHAVAQGVVAGLLFTAAVGVLTFVANRKLPYRKMLIGTGVLLGVVLLVMVGEQAQEMQLAGWLTTTPVPSLQSLMPSWTGLWFAVFPTVETLAAQAVAAVFVLGSYGLARRASRRR